MLSRSCGQGPFASPYSTAMDYDSLVLVASGIGITPALAIIASHKHSRRVNLIWSCRDAALVECFPTAHTVHALPLRIRALFSLTVLRCLWYRYFLGHAEVPGEWDRTPPPLVPPPRSPALLPDHPSSGSGPPTRGLSSSTQASASSCCPTPSPSARPLPYHSAASLSAIDTQPSRSADTASPLTAPPDRPLHHVRTSSPYSWQVGPHLLGAAELGGARLRADPRH
jgi:hypothetical protein